MAGNTPELGPPFLLGSGETMREEEKDKELNKKKRRKALQDQVDRLVSNPPLLFLSSCY